MKIKFNYKSFNTFNWLILMSLCLLTATACQDDDIEEPLPEPAPLAMVLPCDYFETDSILTHDSLKTVDYIIDCYMYLDGNQKIRIEPGVVIEFTADAGLFLDENAKLIAEGTPEKPILLSGTQKGKGFWRGIFLRSEANNRIEHTKIEYAGGTPFTSSSPHYAGSMAVASYASVAMSHVEITNGGNIGIDLTGHSSTVSTENLTITENEGMAVIISAYQAHIFDSSTTITGNAFDYINIVKDYYEVESTVSWKKLDVPYLVDGRVHIKDAGYLTIEAGVEVQFREEGYLQASGNVPPYFCAMNIMGTSTEPVKLSGYNQNYWGGIYYGFSQESNLISHTIIEGANGNIPVGNITNTGAIYMHANPTLTVENTEFKNMENCAYYFYNGASTNTPDTPNFTAINLTLTNVGGGEFCWGDGSE